VPERANAATDLSDPTCFPVAYDPQRGTVALQRIDLDAIGRASFLDGRTPLSSEPVWSLPVVDCPPARHAPALLFHTAFCGSTLLARALHAPPAAVSLKEPGVMLAIAMATLQPDRHPPASTESAARAILGLLARPWQPDGRVLVKPTNQVNRIVPMLLQASPGSRALLLYSSLEQFLLSCCKKLPAAETLVRWMAQALLPGTQLAQRLGVPMSHPFNLVEAAVLTWYAQMEIYAMALAQDDDGRLRSLDIDVMLAEPQAAVAAAADWLQLPGAHEGLEARVAATFSRNAKSQERAFDAGQRDTENALVREHFGPLVRQALQWADDAIAPVATLPSRWQPLLR
jgi:hypothetical protein